MCEVSYRPLIDDMTWSYSRIACFEDCPYRFFLRYICECKDKDKFYASYGSFMHKLIERFYKAELSKDEMLTEFLVGFSENVKGMRPQQSIVEKYIKCGVEYLKSFQPFKYKMIDVEKRVEFKIDEINFIGFIDYLGEQDGEYYIIDNKSRNLKPRSKRKTPTVKDKELDLMLKQLYLYSIAVKRKYGKFPKALCFNCFKSGVFIEEPFNEDTYYKTIKWVKKTIEDIKSTTDFYPCIDYFSCTNICGVSDDCVYNYFNTKGKR